MEHFFNDLNIPKICIKNTRREDRFYVVVHKLWLKALIKHSKLIELLEKPTFEVWPETEEEVGQDWTKIFVRVLLKSDKKVIPLPKVRSTCGSTNEAPLMFSQLLQYVSTTNYKNLWKEAYKKYNKSQLESSQNSQITLASYNDVLREVISRTYGCSIINKCDNSLIIDCNQDFSPGSNISRAIAGVETSSAIFLLFSKCHLYTLHDCIYFSPAILENNFTKLFVVYQLLHCFKSLHDRSLTLGDVTLHDIYLGDDLWIEVFPQLRSNLHVQNSSEPDDILLDCRKMGHKFNFNSKCAKCGTKLFDKIQISGEECLEKLCKLWVAGEISNFTYLTALNNASGRRLNDPSCHHVFPWVTDFASPCGKNWRDLKKSKFRLNKGDRQLDITYENPQSQAPHHVSDVLSPITYYVYMARRTPRSVLCKNVRSKWVPAEYPSSIQRLQEWTPDECVPEFFSDPTVFKSIHDDLDDLEVPPWSCSPEDFVKKHREILESGHVSDRLHHWIDLSFGYKLSGNAAVKAKNVCLHLVDDHKNLINSGVVQLFTLPHPPKSSKSIFWAKIPPKVFVEKYKNPHRDRSISSSTSHNLEIESISNDEYNQTCSKISPLAISRLLSRSRSSLTEEYSEVSSRSSSAQRTKSPPSNNDVTIRLPRDYNPIHALNCVEQFHTFLAKTFYQDETRERETQQTTDDRKNVSGENDAVNIETCSLIQNEFTNRYFAENYGKGEAANTNANANYPNVSKVVDYGKKAGTYGKKFQNRITCNYGEIITARKVRELQILGCLIVEIFMSRQLCPLSEKNNFLFSSRLRSCLKVVGNHSNELPSCVKYVVRLLLQPHDRSGDFKYPTVTDLGLPPPSPHFLLEPLLHCIVPFPKSYFKLYYLITSLKDFDAVSHEMNVLYHFVCDGKRCHEYENCEKTKILLAQIIGECKVKKCVRNIEFLIEDVNPIVDTEVIHLLLPYVKHLLEDPKTAILAAWHLFDPIAGLIGIKMTLKHLLKPLLKLYESDLDRSSLPYYVKSAKLYHHSFLLRLMIKFGLKTFLDCFVTPLVEGAGGYRDHERFDFPLHSHNSKSLKKCSNLRSMDLESEFSTLSSDDSLSDIKITYTRTHTQNSSMSEPQLFHFENEPSSSNLIEHGYYRSLIERLESNVFDDLPLSGNDATTTTTASTTTTTTTTTSATTTNTSTTEMALDATANLEQLKKIGDAKTNAYEGKSQKKSESESDYYIINGKGSPLSFKRSKSDSSGSYLNDIDNYCNNLQKKNCDSKISEMSGDSIVWLSHRLGPVLTAKYLSRNLLRMLTLCYVSGDNLTKIESVESTDTITIANGKVVGDENASKVLQCLSHIAGLYGEQLILLQYIPHMSEMITSCKKRLTPNLEGGLVSCLALLQHIIPYLSDSMLMNHLHDFILNGILHPIIRLIGTTKYCFPNGSIARDILARKYIDTLYFLSLRLGTEMTREHLLVPALRRFFMIFDKAAGSPFVLEQKQTSLEEFSEECRYVEVKRDGGYDEWSIGGTPLRISHVGGDPGADNLSPLPTRLNSHEEKALEELKLVFTIELAYSSYIPFLKKLGTEILNETLINHAYVRSLCEKYEEKKNKSMEDHTIPSSSTTPSTYCPSSPCLANYNNENNKAGASAASTGTGTGSYVSSFSNRIEREREEENAELDLVTGRMENTSRHLRGNWLAYWEHEIGRGDDVPFTIKQIKLQRYVGHSGVIKIIRTLDNENSFISGSKDRTVKLWSLRSEGDGKTTTASRWTYGGHRRAVSGLAYLETERLVGSSDGIVHLWDPFMGADVATLDIAASSSSSSAVSSTSTSSSSSSSTTVGVLEGARCQALLYAATSDATVKIIDVRVGDYVSELKVNGGVTGTGATGGGMSCGTGGGSGAIRCLAIAPSGRWLAAGQTSGIVTTIDCRTGLVLASWRAHEGDTMQAAAISADDDLLVTAGLDQTLAVWNPNDGKINFHIKGNNNEAIHCLATAPSGELITGTTGNRVGVHVFGGGGGSDAPFSSAKLRPDAFKGLLTAMSLLPLNRLLLLGADNGNITLMC